MNIPPYFPQENKYTCSLAVLRMVLATKGILVTENDLIEKVKIDYGDNFQNIWNPTVAKLACQYGIKTKMFARWPLFKKDVIPKAFTEYQKNPKTFNYRKFENKNDNDTIREPLPLAYKEMFEAVKVGCNCVFGGLTNRRLKKLYKEGKLVQTSVRLHLLYPGEKRVFHSILIYKIEEDVVSFHDPARGIGLNCPIGRLLKVANSTGAIMAYSIN